MFHCALSQQRGPSAALRYLRERERRAKATEKKQEVVEPVKAESVVQGQKDGDWDVKKGDLDVDVKVKGQEVFVLDGGFVKWQEKCVGEGGMRLQLIANVFRYGTDKRLTDAYAPDIWADDY